MREIIPVFCCADDLADFLRWHEETTENPRSHPEAIPLANWPPLRSLINEVPDLFRGWEVFDWQRLEERWDANQTFDETLFQMAVDIARQKLGI